jgi:hypothetical protein
MRILIIILLLAAAGAYAASFSRPGVALIENEAQNVRNLLLKAAPGRVATAEPGQTRIPMIVDGVVYEVIVATPGIPRLVPAS